MRKAVEHNVIKIISGIDRIKNARVDIWMFLKGKAENCFLYAKRFSNEFKSRKFLESGNYWVRNGIDIATDSEKNLDDVAIKINKTINDTMMIIDSNVEAKNTIATYKTQENTLYIGLFSSIFALTAIIIAFLSEKQKNDILSALYNIKTFSCILYVGLAILFCVLILKIVYMIYRWVLKIIINLM